MSDVPGYVLTFDLGTSALKAVVYDHNGKQIATKSVRYEFKSPQPGWAEANVNDWKEALHSVLTQLQEISGLLTNVQIMAFTGQMHTAVLLDQNLEPLQPIILWLDRRAKDETQELQDRWHMPPYQLNSTYTLPKLLWLKRNQPDVVNKIRHVIWPKDYLRFLFTGRIMTDITEAGGSGMINWETKSWARERLEEIGIDSNILPTIMLPVDDGGHLLEEMSLKYGINRNVKIIVGAGDVLALISAAPPALGRLSCSIGSSSMIFTPLQLGREVNDPQQGIYTYPLLHYPLLGGVSSTTGSALNWACNQFFPQTSFKDAIESALQEPAGCDGLIFFPFLSGERSPFWNDSLCGGFYGMMLSSKPSTMVRAVMEGVAFSLRYLVERFESLGVEINQIALSGGGAITPGWPQIISNICQKSVCVYSTQETVTRALFAYACETLQPDHGFNQCLQMTFEEPQWIQPDLSVGEIYQKGYTRYKKIVEFLQDSID